MGMLRIVSASDGDLRIPWTLGTDSETVALEKFNDLVKGNKLIYEVKEDGSRVGKSNTFNPKAYGYVSTDILAGG